MWDCAVETKSRAAWQGRHTSTIHLSRASEYPTFGRGWCLEEIRPC